MSSGETAVEKPPMRDALVAAAFELFLERGYEQTTIDDIVTLAGVGRRSFFRYFPAKEGVVFPDHERCLTEMTAFLDADARDADPVRRVCDAARTVLRMYAENPTFSVQRYHLTKKVPGLRAYELSVVWRYERALAGYLRARFTGDPDGALRADVIAAAVVAAHNNALRCWLRSDGRGDASATVDHALRQVQATFGARPARDAGPLARDCRDGEDVVVVVARRGTPLWRVVQQVESALGGGTGTGSG
ncbi:MULTISPECIES: TetR family transcriptional regulator [Streptomyces]|uniref:TetR family transcriptional regulator n=1 Tax=Streptomyces doudnae TaxID=3075536 RepID=A0ABD5EHJ3_9ACTN|nr:MULTISPECIES: TetR family transcriptional regulator [unclassified Streptomyces]MDT0433827.1 TetR family transcriptional regulator [Streptomyces sp. DSM 41981]MYQ62900.1 TetR family transcriptional regulator [Streptomyces sp. SID4950]SCD46698.1 transcriptional regulator, TetR family [Streptomyces sp. SolWspMP-5a-2]